MNVRGRPLVDIRPGEPWLEIVVDVIACLFFSTLMLFLFVGAWALALYGIYSLVSAL